MYLCLTEALGWLNNTLLSGIIIYNEHVKRHNSKSVQQLGSSFEVDFVLVGASLTRLRGWGAVAEWTLLIISPQPLLLSFTPQTADCARLIFSP